MQLLNENFIYLSKLGIKYIFLTYQRNKFLDLLLKEMNGSINRESTVKKVKFPLKVPKTVSIIPYLPLKQQKPQCGCMLSYVCLFATQWIVACQAPLSTEFSRQDNWSGLPFPTPGYLPNSTIKLASLASHALTDSLSLCHLGRILNKFYQGINLNEKL